MTSDSNPGYPLVLHTKADPSVLGGIAIGAIVSAVVGVIVLRARPVKETDAGVEDTITVDNVPGV